MIYAFEEIGPDLPRPPLAARRALLSSGVAVPLETWQALPLAARQAIVAEGEKDAPSDQIVKNAISSVLKRVRFMGVVKDPALDFVPQPVVDGLRAVRPITVAEWQSLRPLDRYTMVALSGNSRLLYRALEEMTSGPTSALGPVKLMPWVGPLAQAEVHMVRPAFADVAAGRLQGGQALVLARTAGVRAARSAHEMIDGYAEKYAGPVELDARLDAEIGGYVWQAHVSTVEGEFFAAASVLAAAAAAVALRDAVAANDPTASVTGVSVREAAWNVGSGAFGDEATIAMNAKAYISPHGKGGASGPLPADDTESSAPRRSGVPVWLALMLVLSTLLAFTAAGFTIQKNGGFRNLYSTLINR